MAAQYVYAPVTGIAVTDDVRVIVTSEMGYVMMNKFDLSKDHPVKATSATSSQQKKSNQVSTVRKPPSVKNSSRICSFM